MKKFLLLFLLLFSINIATAIDTVPTGNYNFAYRYNIYNVSNITVKDVYANNIYGTINGSITNSINSTYSRISNYSQYTNLSNIPNLPDQNVGTGSSPSFDQVVANSYYSTYFGDLLESQIDSLWSNFGSYYLASNPSGYITASEVPYQSSAGGWVNTSKITSTNYKVGINTANPSTALEVNGSINVSNTSYFNGFVDSISGVSTGSNSLNTRAIRPNSNNAYDIGQSSFIYKTLYINSSYIYGSLGIGIVNSTPRASLDVNDSAPNSNLPTMMVTTSQTNTSVPNTILTSTTVDTKVLCLSRDGSLISNNSVCFNTPSGSPTAVKVQYGSFASAMNMYTSGSGNISTGDTIFHGNVKIVSLGVSVADQENMTGHLFKIGANGQYVDVLTSGGVGIGISSPTARLHINSTGTTNALNRDLVISGTLSAIGAGRNLVFTNANTENAMAYVGMTTDPVGNQGELAFGTATSTAFNATERVRIDNSGNVGIGTTIPTAKLEVAGSGFFTGANNPTTGAGFKVEYANGVSNLYSYDYGASTYKNLSLYGTNINLMPQSGNVGIGTSVPLSVLDVSGTSRFRGVMTYANSTGSGLYTQGISGALGLQFQDVGVGNGYYYMLNSTSSATVGISMRNGHSWIGNNRGAFLGVGTSSPSAELHVLNGANNSNMIIFSPQAGTGSITYFEDAQGDIYQRMFDNAGVEGARFRPDGDSWTLNNLGIGTTSPTADFTVVGNNSAATTTGNAQDQIIRLIPSGSTAVFDIGATGSSTHGWLQMRSSSNYATTYNLALNPVGGNVGIGTTTPQQKLVVVGTANITSSVYLQGVTQTNGSSCTDGMSIKINTTLGNKLYCN